MVSPCSSDMSRARPVEAEIILVATVTGTQFALVVDIMNTETGL